MSALNNEEVKKEISNFIDKELWETLVGFYDKYKNPFPTIVEDGCPISVNMFVGRSIRNHIQEKFNVVPDKIKDWGTYEDYIYNMIINMIKEYKKESY